MGSRPKTPTIKVPKPVVYQTFVPEEDFTRADEYIGYLDNETDKLIAIENLTLGNKEKRAYDNLVDRERELGAYYGSLPADQAETGFKIDQSIRDAFKQRVDETTEDVNRARGVFEETTQGGGDKPGIDGPFDPDGGGGGGGDGPSKGLADYQKFLRTYDHTARGKGSKRGKERFSGLDVRFVRDAAKDYDITEEERNKAIIDAVKQYDKDDVSMGGATERALEKLGGDFDFGKKKKKRKKAKKKAKKRREKFNASGKSRFQREQYGRSRYQRTGMGTGRPGGG
tara:strand:+ start:164 stop:1015 length:852 start_codon:yes stop_codon:yes gene_type:complete